MILIFLLTIPFFTLYISFVTATNTSNVYGYVKDNKGNPIEGCDVTAFISGMQEGQSTTNEDGYYEIDLGLLMMTTYVSLHMEPESNFKDKVVGTTVYSGQDKLKNITLEQFFALIVGGASDTRFNIISSGMYQTLVNHYNFNDDNIWLLTYGDVSNRDRQVSNVNILWAIGEIAAKSTSIDHVYIWVTSHGYYDEFQTGVYFETHNISATDFNTALDTITCKVMYIFLGQCFSGAFIPYLNNSQNRAIYTACNSTEPGWGMKYGSTLEYSFWPWCTYRALDPGAEPTQNAEEADTNSDHLVSLDELYIWCLEKTNDLIHEEISENINQHPQRWLGSIIGSDTNDFIGSETYL
ncbi:MAG: hypothetical protein JXA54_02125 [Candidatus Heimdallarchaeota archaeon]|nr:hypothetical protein [Candidatus Heimdallarchaeota archaeon]